MCRRAVRTPWLPLVTGPVVVVTCAALCALWHVGDIVLLVTAAAAALVWEWFCMHSENTGTHRGLPLTVFGIALALLIVFSGWTSEVNGVLARWST